MVTFEGLINHTIGINPRLRNEALIMGHERAEKGLFSWELWEVNRPAAPGQDAFEGRFVFCFTPDEGKDKDGNPVNQMIPIAGAMTGGGDRVVPLPKDKYYDMTQNNPFAKLVELIDPAKPQ